MHKSRIHRVMNISYEPTGGKDGIILSVGFKYKFSGLANFCAIVDIEMYHTSRKYVRALTRIFRLFSNILFRYWVWAIPLQIEEGTDTLKVQGKLVKLMVTNVLSTGASLSKMETECVVNSLKEIGFEGYMYVFFYFRHIFAHFLRKALI